MSTMDDEGSSDSNFQISNPPTPRSLDLDNSLAMGLNIQNNSFLPAQNVGRTQPSQSKYAQLLAVIEELGKDIRPTYAGSKSSAERLKRGIVHARILVRECLMETERSARQ